MTGDFIDAVGGFSAGHKGLLGPQGTRRPCAGRGAGPGSCTNAPAGCWNCRITCCSAGGRATSISSSWGLPPSPRPTSCRRCCPRQHQCGQPAFFRLCSGVLPRPAVSGIITGNDTKTAHRVLWLHTAGGLFFCLAGSVRSTGVFCCACKHW